jgi:23S rRNA (guanosine2251-2'-O)-methyltransferase
MAKQNLTFGMHAITSVLENSPEKIKQLWVKQGRDDHKLQQIIALAEQRGIAIQQVPVKTLDKLVNGRHQGVVAELGQAQVSLNENDLTALLDKTEQPFLLILDGVEDPHNLGACLRSADAAGVTAVIAPKDKAVGITPIVSKVACGAAETVPFVQVTNLARTLEMLKQRGIWLYGAAGEAEQTLYQQALTGPIALVMGAEGKGLRRLTREHCDFLLKIPMVGTVESLNVSVATGICLFEILRQRSSVDS